MIKMILCADLDGGIGCKNKLIYHIKEDMEFFTKKTINHKIVMGYNTWLSLPKKPLPKRDNYILYEGNDIKETDNIHVLRSIDEIVELAKDGDIYIIGGAMLYNTMLELDLVDEVYLTLVSFKYDADVFVNLQNIFTKFKNSDIIKRIECNSGSATITRFYN